MKPATPARAIVLHPSLKRPKSAEALRTPEARLEEAVGLAAAIELSVVAALLVPIDRPRPATLMGTGKVEEIAELVKEKEADLVIVDGSLSPIQQRNLEKGLGCKVIDRTALILEIFGARARTREGMLQVELAALDYQKSRLVRSWTHLERQRGGFGFMGGPGESQIEIDRRLIGDEIAKIKLQLETVKRTRELHRKKRRAVPFPVVALVGYTNAGKSTLFNRLTGADVFAENLLFATLDPTLRQVKLPSGRQVIFSDTVGFISDLPTQLVAAFRATLEEVVEARLLLHVRDIASPSAEAERKDVEGVLKDMGLGERLSGDMIEVWNKCDLLAEDAVLPPAPSRSIRISALTGEGVDGLLKAIDEALAVEESILDVEVDNSDGATLAWLYEHGRVLERRDGEDAVFLKVGLSETAEARFAALGRERSA